MRKLSLSLALLAALAALAMLAVSCKSEEKPGSASTPAAKTDPGAAKTDIPKETPKVEAPAAGKGVYSILPECETGLATVAPCYETLKPDNPMRQAFESMKESARSVEVITPEAKQFTDQIAAQCTKLVEATKAQNAQICPSIKL
jgi:hypothetical protein